MHRISAVSMFHLGQGVYRSSYKNARRLAATETNIAYRTSDHECWRQLDFVDICDRLSAEYGSTNTSGKGCYPKDFKFTGWHPHCRCHAESILKTDEEIAEDNRRILEGEEPMDYKQSEKYVKDVPKEFEEWVKANDERITKANSVPYFLSDNPKYTGVTPKHGSIGSLTGTKRKISYKRCVQRIRKQQAYNTYKRTEGTNRSNSAGVWIERVQSNDIF